MDNQVTGELKIYGKVLNSEDGVFPDTVVMYPRGPKVNKNATLKWSYNENEGKGSAEIISYGRQAYSWGYDVDQLNPAWIEAESETEEPDGLVHESPEDNMLRSKVRMVFSQPTDENGNSLPEKVTVTITQTIIGKDSEEEDIDIVTFTSSENR